jgi:hypothetical protein
LLNFRPCGREQHDLGETAHGDSDVRPRQISPNARWSALKPRLGASLARAAYRDAVQRDKHRRMLYQVSLWLGSRLEASQTFIQDAFDGVRIVRGDRWVDPMTCVDVECDLVPWSAEVEIPPVAEVS